MAIYEKIYDVIVVGADNGKNDASDHLPVMTVFQVPVL